MASKHKDWTRDHDFLPFGIGAHGEMGEFLGHVLGFTQHGSTHGAQRCARREQIADLKAQARHVRLPSLPPGRFQRELARMRSIWLPLAWQRRIFS